MRTGLVKFIWVSLVSFVVLLGGSGTIQAAEDSSSQVVMQFLTLYPTQMEEAANYTTYAFRMGRSPRAWAEYEYLAFLDSRLEYVYSEVSDERILNEGRAQVLVDVYMRTVFGDQRQKELYELYREPNGLWLIESIQEYEERYVGFQF